jgi:CheY-like chemotaxis protein
MIIHPLEAAGVSAVVPEADDREELNCCGCWRGIALVISRKFNNVMHNHYIGTEMAINRERLKVAYAENAERASFKRRIRVLLADDNPMSLKIWQHNLSKYECEIISVENGQVALEEVENSEDHPFDLVILDEEMPKRKGSEAAKAIRSLVNNNIRIFSCSSLGRDIGERNIEYFDGFLPKGWSSSESGTFQSVLEKELSKSYPLLRRQMDSDDSR